MGGGWSGGGGGGQECYKKTDVVKSVILRATAPKALAMAGAVMVEAMAGPVMVEGAGVVDRPVTLAAGGEVGHLSRDCPSEPTSERVCYKCKQPGHLQA
ncbi:hypothetical protein ACLMJK_002029, partial [Lecanora helva]